MKKVNLNKNLKAISTIEVILSITIFSMIATGIIPALFYGIHSTTSSSNSISANYLAEEQLEVATNIAHSNYNLLDDGEYHISESGGSWVLAPGVEQVGEFTRKIVIAPGLDINTKEITSEVTWTITGNQQQISLTKYLTDWKRVGIVIGEPTPTPPPTTNSCLITYDVYADWGTGFNADVTITNAGTADIIDWLLEWTFSGDQTINGAWDAIENQSGEDISMTNESWNNIISANGGTETINIYADNEDSHYAPLRESFKVNGQVCEVTYIGISEFAPPPSSGYCHVEASTTYSWGYFQTDIVITNISSNHISGWDLEWSFGDKKEIITSLWDADWEQKKKDVSAEGFPYNQNISPNGGTINFGYTGTYKNKVTNFDSSDFKLNDVECE